MADYRAGRLLVSIIPDMRGAPERIRREFSGLGPYDVKINAVVDDRGVAGLRTALRSLPDVVLTADSSAADREVKELRGRIMALSDARVGVDLSAAEAKREVDSIRADLARLAASSPSIAVRVDAAAAESALQGVSDELGRVDGRTANVKVTADTGRANAALSATGSQADRLDGRSVALNVIADVARAIGPIVAVGAAANMLSNRRYMVSIGADTASAVAGIARVVALVAALSGGAGIVAGLAGAFAGLGAAGVVAGAGVGAAVLGFLGVGKALSAMSAQEESAAATSRQSAQQQAQHAAQVQSAKERLSQASIAADRARTDAERDNGRASQEVGKARADAARSVAAAEQSASRAIISASQQQATALRTYNLAVQATRMAQQDLTRAWEDGRRALEDLQDQVDGNALDQRQAAFDLADARKALAAAQAGGDSDQIARAQLQLDKQLETIDQLNKRTQRGAKDNAAAQRAGVAGSQQYVAALDKVRGAYDSELSAGMALASANANRRQAEEDGAASVAEARRAGNESIVAAEQRLADVQEQGRRSIQAADQQVIESQRALTQALAQTGDAGASAADKVAAAFAQLSPAAAAFATFLYGLKPVLDGLSSTAAAGLFPPLTEGIQALLTQLPLITTVVGQLATGMGLALKAILVDLASPFWAQFFALLGNSAGTLLPALAGALMAVARAGAILIMALLPLAPAGIAFLTSIADLLAYLSPFVAVLLGGCLPAAQAFLAALYPLGPVMAALAPILNVLGVMLAQVLGAVLTALAPVLVALTPLITAFAQSVGMGLVAALSAATPFLVMLATWLSANPGLVLGVVAAIGTLLAFLRPLGFVLGIVATMAVRALLIAGLGAAFAAVGLQGSFLARALLAILQPFSAIRLGLGAISAAATAAGGWLALLRNGIMMLGRALLGALGPFGILALVLTALYMSSEPFRNAMNGLLGVLMTLVGQIVSAVMPIFLALSGAFGMIMGAVGGLIAQVAVALIPVITIVSGVLMQLAGVVLPILTTVVSVLVPVIMILAQMFSGLVGVLAAVLVPVLTVLVGVLQWLSPILAPLVGIIMAIRGAMMLWAVAQTILNVVMAMNPITLIIIAVLALVAAVVWAYNNFTWFREAVQGVWNFLVTVATWLVSVFVAAWNIISGAVMWAWTNVFSPVIGFIWTALQVLGAIIWVVLVAPFLAAFNVISLAIGWLYTNVIQPIFTGIGIAWALLMAGINWVWLNVLKPVWDAIIAALNWLYINVWIPIMTGLAIQWALLMAGIDWVWLNVLKPVWDAIIGALNWLYANVWLPIMGYLGAEWQKLMALIDWVWLNILKPCFDAVANGLAWLRDRFNDAVTWIGDIWNKIRGFLAKPINFMIDVVWNKGVVPAWNAVAGLVGLGPIQPLGLIPEAATGGYLGSSTDAAGGGLLRGPGTSTSDSILGVDAQGVPTAKVSRNEFVVNAGITKRTLPFLSALNAGQGEALQAAGGLRRVAPKRFHGMSGIQAARDGGLVGYAGGGAIERVDAAKQWLSGPAQGIPYVWGGGGMSGMDCSGMQAAVTHILSGRSPLAGRIGTTASMPWGGFTPGLTSQYSIGNKPSDHMAGTLGGQNVEQHGPDGTPFRFPSRWGADAGYFPQKWSLPVVGGQFVSGGEGSGGGWNWILDKARAAFDEFTNPAIDAVRAFVGEPPPEWRRVPPALAVKMRDTIRDFVFGKAEEAGGGAMGPDGDGDPFIVRQISDAARARGVGKDGAIIGVATGMVESNLRNLPGGDRDSVGVFQQRPSMGWGSVAECMNVLHAAHSFFSRFPANWRNMPPGDVAQSVQRSAFPGKYAQRIPGAIGLVNAHGGPFDSGGIARGMGLLRKDTNADERVLDPIETDDHGTLAAYRRMIEDGRLAPAGGLSARELDVMSGGGGVGGVGGREMHLHVHGDVNDPMDVDSLYNQLDWRERSSSL